MPIYCSDSMKTLETSLDGGVLSLRVIVSRLDASTAPDFKKEIDTSWAAGITKVRADLASVDFIDSSGVGALLSLYKRLPPPNPGVKLQHVKPPVQAVIELLRLHRIFEIEN